MEPPTAPHPEEALHRHLAFLESMLLLLRPDQPFQPVLAASIDLLVWRATFYHECELLLDACKKTNQAPTALQACEELHLFVTELFRAEHYVHYIMGDEGDDARDPQDFLPDPESLVANRHLQAAREKAAEDRDKLDTKRKATDVSWREATADLHALLTKPPDRSTSSMLEVIRTHATGDDTFGFTNCLASLSSLLKPPPDAKPFPRRVRWTLEQKREETLWQIRCFLTSTFLPELTQAAHDALPCTKAKGAKKGNQGLRSVRQRVVANTRKAATTWLTRFDIARGWHRLFTDWESTLALRTLVDDCRKALSPVPGTKTATIPREEFFKALHGLRPGIVKEDLLSSWEHKCEKEPLVADIVIESLRLMLKPSHPPTGAVGPAVLLSPLDISDSPQADEKKISRYLQDLTVLGLVTTDPKTWVPWPSSDSQRRSSAKASKNTSHPKQKWLVNPLGILIKDVHRAFFKAPPLTHQGRKS